MGFPVLALVLFWMNVGFYLILWCLSLLRLIFYPRRVLDDFQSHTRGVGFFTGIAGTCLLGANASSCLKPRPGAWRCYVWALAWGSFSSMPSSLPSLPARQADST